MEHEWVEVRDRRWCIRCDCFQAKRPGESFWETRKPCADIYNRDQPRPLSDVLELALSLPNGERA